MTTKGAQQLVASAALKLSPTAPLRKEEQAVFDAIISSREKETFSAFDLQIATRLAKMVVHMDRINVELEADGYQVEGRHGPRVSPALSAMLQVANSVQALSRQLGLSASAQGVSGESQQKRNVAARQAEEAISRAQASDLL
jgi:hypothetical protein